MAPGRLVLWDNPGMSTKTGSLPAGPALDDLSAALSSMAGALDGFRFRLPSPGAERWEHERAELVRSIREHLIPRLADRDAPLVAGFFGAGGAGKSVIVNTLAQRRVSMPGTVRPTTRAAVIWAHRNHAARYWREFLLQVRERVGPAVETILGDDPLTTNLTLIDTPSFDIVSAEGSRIAYDVLSVADLCVFVASAVRYADAASWDFLRLAQRRGLPILLVLNRLPGDPGARPAVIEDYARRLAADGLLLEADPALIFPVSEHPLEAHGGLAASSVAGLRRELEELADREFREVVASQAIRGAVNHLTGRVGRLEDALATERAAASALGEPVDVAYGHRTAELVAAIQAGGLGAADAESRRRAARIVTHLAGEAAQSAAAAWDQHPIGRLVLQRDGRALWRHGSEAHAAAEQAMANWAAGIADLAKERARRRWQRRRSVGVMAVAAAHDPDAKVPPRLKRALGPDGVQTLLRWSSRTLRGDLGEVLNQDADRFRQVTGDPEALGVSAAAITDARDRLAAATRSAG